MKVIVLGGGNSPERDVSLRSALAVKEALISAGYDVITMDPKDGWEQVEGISGTDIVFPILHGAEGEDGIVQKLLEDKKLKYLGSSSTVSKLCFDKGETRAALIKAGITVAEGANNITYKTYKLHALSKVPHVLKVQRGGSSIGTYIVNDPNIIDELKIKEVFGLDDEAVIEELIVGTEITVPILDQKALPVIEIVPPLNGEFDYENKYNGKSQEICPAVSLNKQQQLDAQILAEKVHKILGCRHLSRVDIMMRTSGEMVILEDNTMPGMTNQSLFPLSAKVSGLDMPELMKEFVKLVERDYLNS